MHQDRCEEERILVKEEEKFSWQKCPKEWLSSSHIPLSSSDVYEADRILASKTVGKDLFYLVKWKGYSENDNSWEPSANVTDALVRAFDCRQQPPRPLQPQSVSGYGLFVQEMRPKIILGSKGITTPELVAEMKRRWGLLDAGQRSKYSAMAAENLDVKKNRQVFEAVQQSKINPVDRTFSKWLKTK